MIDYNVLLSNKIDIVSVVSKYTKLIKRGSNYIGLCPLHKEDSPSFNINTDKKVYHCFGCNSGGNVITFAMNINNVDFLTAVKILISEYSIVIDIKDSEEISNRKEIANNYKNTIDELNKNIYKDKIAYDYLKNRKLSNETISYFKLGIIKSLDNSIILENKTSYLNRIIIPIQDINGNYVAISGRSITNEKPKYINSSSNIYDKNKTMYGLNYAKNYIKESDYVVIVEGYFDLIKMWQNGIKNVVACCCSNLSDNQITLLKQYTNKFLLCFDGDLAGKNATVTSIKNCFKYNVEVKIINIIAKDPDELIDSGKINLLKNMLDNPISVVDFLLYYFDKLSRLEQYNKIIEIIDNNKNKILRNDLFKELELKLGINNNKENKTFCCEDEEFFYTLEGSVIHYLFYNYEYFLDKKNEIKKHFSDNKLTQILINDLYYSYNGSVESVSNKLSKKMILTKPAFDTSIELLIKKLSKQKTL